MISGLTSLLFEILKLSVLTSIFWRIRFLETIFGLFLIFVLFFIASLFFFTVITFLITLVFGFLVTLAIVFF